MDHKEAMFRMIDHLKYALSVIFDIEYMNF